MNAILTGCDKNTEWQLPWFVDTFRKANPDVPIIIADFGLTPKAREYAEKVATTIFSVEEGQGWYKKPEAMIKASVSADKVVWLDTDCEVRGSVEGIFREIEPGKLSICEDRPWTVRRPDKGRWYNTGVVGFTGTPEILIKWNEQCKLGSIVGAGDQEILHDMFNGNEILKMQHIKPLHSTYNQLRIDLIDRRGLPNPVVMHWTGAKGNEMIRKLMNGAP